MKTRKPYPKEVELHERYSNMNREELRILEEFIRKSGNASSAAGASNTKEYFKKHEIIVYYINKS